MWVVHTKNVGLWYLCCLASKKLAWCEGTTAKELRSGSDKMATTRCVITQKSAVIIYFAVATLKSRKFLLARRHKFHTPTFLVCTTHWHLTNNCLLTELTAWCPFRAQKSELPTTRPPQLALILLLVRTKPLLHSIPITATAQDLHHPQYLQHHKIPHGPNDSLPLPPAAKKNPTHIIWLFWYHMTNWSWNLTYMYSWRLLEHITTILMPILKTRITGL